MRDEMDARMWVEHHEGFADGVDRAIAAARAGLARLAGWDGSSHQLLAMAAAFLVTSLSLAFTSSSAA